LKEDAETATKGDNTRKQDISTASIVPTADSDDDDDLQIIDVGDLC
jgi:hypothetical protein